MERRYKAGKGWARILAEGYLPQLVTPEPIVVPARIENLIVRMKRGGAVHGRVLDHAGKPIAGARVYLAGTQRLQLADGKPGITGLGGADLARSTFQGGTATTDADGRFALSGGEGTGQKAVVAAAGGQMITVAPITEPGRELNLTLPQPGTLIVRYDIADDAAEGKLCLWLMTGELDRAVWRDVISALEPKVANGRQIALDLTPGTYDFARTKSLRAGGGPLGATCERRTIVIEAGETQRVDLVRSAGFSIRGEVTGLKETDAPGAYIYVRSPKATGDPHNMTDWHLPTFDAMTCAKDGLFQTARLEPGTYTIIAEAYSPETPEQQRRSGWRLLAYVGMVKVTVSTQTAPPPVKIELRPRAERAGSSSGPAPSETPPSGSRREQAPASSAKSEVRTATSSQSLVAAAAWSDPVEGVSLRLQVDRTRWGASETPAFTLDLQNQGQRDFITSQLQEMGRLEVDGVWYGWTGAGVWSRAPFPPGRRYEGLPVTLTPDWRPKQEAAMNPQPPPYLPLRLLPGQHTIRFAVTCRDANAPRTKTVVKKGDPIPEVVVTSNPVQIEITSSNEAPAVAAVPWGRPVDGVSVQLRSDHFAWTAEDSLTLAASVQNQGQRSLRVAQAQQLGELEIDGVSYHWAGDIDVKSSAFPPGRRYDDIPVNLTTNWQTKEGKPLQLGPSRHTVRFAVMASPSKGPGRTPSIRAVSNPIQINLVPGVSQRAALVSKYLSGYALRTVRRQTGDKESITEVLTTPSGEEIDLQAARSEWRGTPGLLLPVGSNRGPFAEAQMWWRNPKLTTLAPSLKLKIATAKEAEDITRVVLGLFKGSSFENWPIKAQPWEHGWVVNPNYVGPPAQVFYQGPLELGRLELVLEDGILKDVRHRDWGGKLLSATAVTSAVEPGWGEPVEGLSVRLQSDKEVWYLARGVALRLGVRNLGNENLFVPESQELGELEVDGVWYTFSCPWSDPYYVAREPLASGQQFDNIGVFPIWNWRNGSMRVGAQVGHHTIRFAVMARRGEPNRGQTVRAVSNPLEVEFRRGAPPR